MKTVGKLSAQKKFHRVGAVICLALMAIPFLFAPFFSALDTDRYSQREPFPSLISSDGQINGRFSAQFERWFQDHFAFRKEFISLNSLLNLRLFGTSQIADVLIGQSGMLFYSPTAPDFEDRAALTPEELDQLTESLQRVQTALSEKGIPLYIAIPPNKNTIYPENMPPAYRFRQTGGNQDRLYAALLGTGIHVIDLREPLLIEKESSDVYYLTDTHWNPIGARVAVKELLRAIKGITDPDIPLPDTIASYTEGDLARMLGLQGYLTEKAPKYTDARVYDKGINYLRSDLTVRGDGEGKLLIFRDSFATAAVPLLKKYFSEITLRWEVPFDMTDAGNYDAVLIMIVERNIRDLGGAHGL